MVVEIEQDDEHSIADLCCVVRSALIVNNLGDLPEQGVFEDQLMTVLDLLPNLSERVQSVEISWLMIEL